MFRYQVIKEEIDVIKTEQARKYENDIKLKEEKTLESLENLFHGLGGEESDVESKSEIIENAEERQEDVVEEPVGDVEEINLREEQPIDIEEREEELVSGLEPVIDAISKQESLKEKKEEVDPVSARIEKLEKWIQKIAVSGPGSGEVRILKMDDVDTTDLANNKILKYQSSSGKFIFTAAGGGGGDVDLSAVDQNIIPDGNGTRDLGGSSNKWKDLYLSGSTIVLGTTSLSIDESGEFQTQNDDINGYHLGMNMHRAGGQSVDWPHVHFIPRHYRDTGDSGDVGSVRLARRKGKSPTSYKTHPRYKATP